MKKEYRMKDFMLSFIKKHLFMVIVLCLLMMLCALAELLPPFALRYLIDSILLPGVEYHFSSFIFAVVFYVLSYIFISLFTILENLVIDSFGQKLIHELRYKMMKKSTRMKYSYFTHHGKGEMTSKIIDDVNAIETLFASGLVTLIISVFKVLGILISVYLFSWVLGLFLTVILPLLFYITRSFQKQMLKNQIRNRKAINKLNNHLSETKENILTIHNLSAETYREKGFISLLQDSYQSRKNSALFDSVFSPIVQMIRAVLIAVVSLLVFYSQEGNSPLLLGITVGTFAASLSLISNVFKPVEAIGLQLQEMQEGLSGVKRVEEYLSEDEIPDTDENIKAEALLQQDDIIHIQAMTYHYEDGEEKIFSAADLVLKKKEKVTIIGRTGAGKTTLFRLLLGILIPTDGHVYIGGKDSYLIPNKEKSRIFGYVEQGFSSIDGTIMDQITLKDTSLTLEKVKECMKKVYLDDYVENEIKDGYQAEFKENLFSRGQLQLLSLARALVHDPEILLFDEISANLDSETEKKILEALSSASADKTVISISHRLSDQLGFDKTIEVKDGKMIVQEQD